jgi:hypothetical protein
LQTTNPQPRLRSASKHLISGLRIISISHLYKWLMLYVGGICIFSAWTVNAQSTAIAAGPSTDKPALVPPSTSIPKSKLKFEGKAEVTVVEDNTKRAQTATRLYKDGVKALDKHDYIHAAVDFMQAGDIFQSLRDCEKFLAEARFAEAQSRRLAGQTAAAARLYQTAVDLFEEYDPLNAYLKAALDNLRPLAPQLRGKINQSEVRLKALSNATRLVIVDRNIILKGGVDNGIILTDVEHAKLDNDFIRKTVYKAFCEMTCLETTALGSNSITAETRWLPLIAKGSIVSVSASSSNFLNPLISVKLNGHYYNVPIDLPGLSANRRTVFLLTDGSNIIAIDPVKETVWLLTAHFKGKDADFSWKNLEHRKGKAVPI